MNKNDYIWYLILSLLFWIAIVFVFKFAIIGEIDLFILLCVIIIGAFYSFINLGLAKESHSRESPRGLK